MFNAINKLLIAVCRFGGGVGGVKPDLRDCFTVGLVYGKIETSRVKMLNFSAFPSFLPIQLSWKKLRPKNVYIYGYQYV
jgi:hypothetical protein